MSLVAHVQGQVWPGATAPGVHPLLQGAKVVQIKNVDPTAALHLA